MSKYRKKPVEIEAMQYLGFDVNGGICELFLGNDFESHLPSRDQIIIRTLEGELTASKGDWLIRGVQGEHYPCKPDIFAATYEPVQHTEQESLMTAGWTESVNADLLPFLDRMEFDLKSLRLIASAKPCSSDEVHA